MQDDDNQVDTSRQGGKAPRNPITGDRLTPVQDPQREGYQATQQVPQSGATSARIFKQLDAEPEGRPFGGETLTDCLCSERALREL